MYVDIYFDSKKEKSLVVERDNNGNRQYKEYSAEYSFYYSDKNGKYLSIYNDPCSLFTAQSNKVFRNELKKLKTSGKIFESDIKPIFKTLEKHYKNSKAPNLHVSFFDIEVDFHQEKGFANPDDPFNEITAITVYNNWQDKCYTLVQKPKTLTNENAKRICNKFEDTYLCDNEEEILLMFLELIEDSDVLSRMEQ